MTSVCTQCDPNLRGPRRGEHHFSGRFGDWSRLTVVIGGDAVVPGVYEIEIGEISRAWVLVRPVRQCGNCGQRSALETVVGPFDVRSRQPSDLPATPTIVSFQPDGSHLDALVTTSLDDER